MSNFSQCSCQSDCSLIIKRALIKLEAFHVRIGMFSTVSLTPYRRSSRYLLVRHFCLTTNYGLSSRYPCDRDQISSLGTLSHPAIILIPVPPRPSAFSLSYYLDRAVVCVGPPNSLIFSACKCKACALKLVKLVSGQICREAKKVSL